MSKRFHWFVLAQVCASTVALDVWALPKMGPAFATDAPLPAQEDKHVYDLGSASDGQNIFTVFEEGGSIRGMLVDADGETLLPSMPFYAPWTEAQANYYPAVAFGGGNYLITWWGAGIQALFVGLDGAPVGEPLTLSETGYSPSVVWLQDEFVVVWQDTNDAGSDIASRRVNPDGTLADVVYLTDDGTASEPKLAAAGTTGALVTWTPNSDAMNLGVQALLLDANGQPASEPLTVRTVEGTSTPEVASDGTGYLVAWVEPNDAGVMAATVSAAGVVSDYFPVSEGGSLNELSLVGSASGYVAVWKDYTPEETDNLAYKHISSAGAALTGGLLTAYPVDYSFDPALLPRGDGYWIAYQGVGVLGAFTDEELTPTTEPVGLSLVPHSQNSAVMAFDGTYYVLAWADEREGDSIFSGRVVRVNQAGRVLEAEPLLLSSDSNRGNWYLSSSAGAGTTVFTWTATESRDIYVRTLNGAGELSPAVSIGVAGPSGNASLATHDGEYELVYPGAVNGEFWAQHLDAEGKPSAEPRAIVVPEGTQDLTLLGTTDGYVVLFGLSAETQLAAFNPDASLDVVLPFGSGHFPVESANGGGKTYLIWPEADGARSARAWAMGNWVGDSFTISADARFGQTVWDGTQFAAVWEDENYFGHWATLQSDGSVSASEPLFADLECGPSLASNGAGQLLLSCIRYDRDYSRRLVNYLLGEPLADTDPVVTPDDVDAGAGAPEPDPTQQSEPTGDPTTEPEEATSTPGSETTEPPAETEDPADGEPSAESSAENEPDEASEETEGTPQSDTSAQGAVDAGAGQQLNEAAEESDDDDGGCHLAAGKRTTPWAAAWLVALGLVGFARRRKAQG